MFLLFFARVLMHAWTRVYVLTVDRSTTGDTWRVYSVVREARRLKQLAVQSPNWYGYGCVAPNTYGYDQLANWNSAAQTSTNELVGGWRILSHVCGLFSHTHTSHRIQHSPIFYSDVGEFVSFFAVAVLLLFCRSRLALTDTSKWDDGRPVAVLYYLNRIELKSSRKYSTHFFKNLESDFVWARDFASWLLTWSDLTWRSSPSVWFEFGRLCVCIVCGHKSRISFACY